MRIFLTIISLLTGVSALAQNRVPYSYFLVERKVADASTEIKVNAKKDTVLVAHYKTEDIAARSFKEFTKTYKGTPYFMNGWYKGIFSTASTKDLPVLMAYNTEKQQLFVTVDRKGEAIAVNPTEFTIENHQFIQLKGNFYEIIYAGKTKILKQYLCKFQSNEPEKRTGYEPENSGEYDGEFINSVKYFWVENNQITEISTKRKLLKLSHSHKDSVEKYIKENRLKTTNPKDLIAIMKFYEAL